MIIESLWQAVTSARKTGPIPVQYVGATREQTVKSCSGCALRPKSEGGSGDCFARIGTPAMAHAGMYKACAKGKDYSLGKALAERRYAAKVARFGFNGDPSWVANLANELEQVRQTGMRVLGYTHYWRDKANAWLADVFMASCNNLEEADEAADMGFRPAVLLPFDWKHKIFKTPKGRQGIVCPAQMNPRLDCESCLLCVIGQKDLIVGFIDHGPKVRTKQKTQLLRRHR